MDVEELRITLNRNKVFSAINYNTTFYRLLKDSFYAYYYYSRDIVRKLMGRCL